jgi:hypothetical protein
MGIQSRMSQARSSWRYFGNGCGESEKEGDEFVENSPLAVSSAANLSHHRGLRGTLSRQVTSQRFAAKSATREARRRATTLATWQIKTLR